MSVQEDVETMQAWLKSKNIKCAACGHAELTMRGVVGVVSSWAIEPTPEPAKPGRKQAPPTPQKTVYALQTMGAKAQPDYTGLAQVNCESCGFAMHFDAEKLGLDVRE